MKNKRTLLIILTLVVASSVLTLTFKSRYYLLGQKTTSFTSGFGNTSGIVPMMEKQGIVADSMPRSGYIPPYYGNDALEVNDRVYQKSSSHSLIVDDVSVYLRGIKEYVLSVDGRVLNSSVSSGDDFNSGYLYVKVPVDKFDEATGRVSENVNKIVNENINSSDITGQLVNTTDQLQVLKDNKSLQEAALEDAKTEVEKRRYQLEIDRLDRQIVAAQNSVNNVEQKVEYATLSISVADNERFFNPNAELGARDELSRAWNSLKVVLKVGAYFGIWIVVYSIIWLPIVWIINKLIKKLKK